jgi:hypothetical protein
MEQDSIEMREIKGLFYQYALFPTFIFGMGKIYDSRFTSEGIYSDHLTE